LRPKLGPLRKSAAPVAPWRRIVARYQRPDLRRALWQVGNTFVPYAVILALMVASLGVSYWLTLGLAAVAAGFLLRVFIMMHDCGHGSFFKGRRWNDLLGFICGVLTFTPYHYWRHTHAIHHATAGNLDKRGVGDIWTMTVREYEAAPWRTRFTYRVYRNPLVIFVVGPAVMFLIKNRFASRGAGWRWQRSVLFSNLAIFALASLAVLILGWKSYLLIQVPIMVMAATAGVWLFYVQHQFEGVYWERQQNWDYFTTAMQGSSFYKLPRLLQWFSGNIGFHHIHHLSPSIPNYHLEKCHRENSLLQQAKTLSLWSSLKSARYRLWDEERGELVGATGNGWL
jgi:omega-6 fatty acid desaturase (delta-12 desaturase)